MNITTPNDYCHRWPSRNRIPFLFAVWILCPIALALFIWWFSTHGQRSLLLTVLATTFVYFWVFSAIFAGSMPYLAPRLFALRRPWSWLLYVPVVTCLSAVGAAIVGVILVNTHLYPATNWNYWSHFGQEVIFDTGVALVINFIFIQNWQMHAALREKERALKLASEAQLASLESRVHPHFLFNALNSVSALTRDDPAKAEQLIQRLATLLRFSLDANDHGLVTLDEELKIVRDYLEIEQARFGSRLASSVSVAPGAGSLKTPPLAVQTLVENSVKHAIAPRREGGEVRVGAETRGDNLVLEVWDSGPGFDLAATPGGHGLDNLAARLKSLFDGRARLQADKRDGGAAVTITMPIIRNGASTKS